jgi:hypothetical protein
MAAAERAPEPVTKPGITVEYRNIGQVDVKVYPVDLMQLYLTRRNLDGIASIDLAGVTPLVEKTVALGDGADYDDKSKTIDLPLNKEGAYLTMIRGENLYASGIVLVSPLEMEVLEEGGPAAQNSASPGVRVTVRDARTKELLPKVQVKVIGSATGQFVSGETDLRGVFVADGVGGLTTAVARRGDSQYAFFRGTKFLGVPGTDGTQSYHRIAPNSDANKAVPGPANDGLGRGNQGVQSLDANIKMQNESNSVRQLERLQQRYSQPANKAKGAQAGGFR